MTHRARWFEYLVIWLVVVVIEVYADRWYWRHQRGGFWKTCA